MKRFLSLVAAALCGSLLTGAIVAHAGPPILAALSMPTCTQRSDVALSTTSEVLFAANLARKSVTLTNNDSAIVVYVRNGATASTASLRVPPGGSWTLEPAGGYIWTGTIDAIAASGTPAISAEECF